MSARFQPFRSKPVTILAVQLTDQVFDGDHLNPEHVPGVRYDPVARCASNRCGIPARLPRCVVTGTTTWKATALATTAALVCCLCQSKLSRWLMACTHRRERAMSDQNELYYAHMEADRNEAEKAYFEARPSLGAEVDRALFRAGFERAYAKLWPLAIIPEKETSEGTP